VPQKHKYRIIVDLEVTSDQSVEDEKKELMGITLNEYGAYGEFDVSRVEVEHIK